PGGDNYSQNPSISGDGRFVAFESYAANLVGSDTNGTALDVFVHDRNTGTTTLLTAGADGYSSSPSISGDGRFVAFESYATNLVASDPNGAIPDIFLHDRDTGATVLLTPGGGGPSFCASISGDGRYVAFTSGAS